MRVLAIGDIHGCMAALRTLEAYVPFLPGDRIVTLGDYVNRGPDSRSVIEWLIDAPSRYKLVALRGNHEQMMLAARKDASHYNEWMACGGQATLTSYGGHLDKVPAAHWQFLQHSCRPYFENATHFFVHANAFPSVPLEEQPDYMLYWEPLSDPQPHDSGKIMICGHTPQRSGNPGSFGHAVCIDTCAHAGGWLTCLDAATGEYWQASQSAQTRKGNLEAIT